MERVTSLGDTETPILRHRRIGLLYGQYRIPDDFVQLEVIERANTYSSPVYFAPTAQLLWRHLNQMDEMGFLDNFQM